MECQRKEMQLADDEDFGSHCLGLDYQTLKSIHSCRLLLSKSAFKLLQDRWLIMTDISTIFKGNGGLGCGTWWSTLGPVKQQGHSHSWATRFVINGFLFWFMLLNNHKWNSNKIFMVFMQHAITTRFCAFFSLTMVLVSTVTFIISTIDELQMNELGEVGS